MAEKEKSAAADDDFDGLEQRRKRLKAAGLTGPVPPDVVEATHKACETVLRKMIEEGQKNKKPTLWMRLKL